MTKTSWGQVAGWYDNYLTTNAGTYQAQVIWPNLKRLLALTGGERVLDLACGNGYFSRLLAGEGARVTGVDVSAELIKLAQAKKIVAGQEAIKYLVAPADKLTGLADNSFDKVICVLALQNIEKVKGVMVEVSRVLKNKGQFYLVLNHPAFRVPRQSEWGFDLVKQVQYRRLDQYLSESQVAITMNPGAREPSEQVTTLTYHRPLQYYFKALTERKLLVSRLEEWVSSKQSQAGPRAKAEDRARHEFPLFLLLEAVKLK